MKRRPTDIINTILAMLVLAVPQSPRTDAATAQAMQAALDRATQAARHAAGAVPIQVRSTSVHRSTLDNAATIRSDVTWISILTFAALAVIAFFQFLVCLGLPRFA